MNDTGQEQQPVSNADRFITEVIRAKYPSWDGASWDAWTPPEVSQMVRHIAQDFLDEHGHGHDWQEAAAHAQFVVCGIFNDIQNFRQVPPLRRGPDLSLHLEVLWPGREESFQMLVEAPREHLLPPIPVPNGVVAHPMTGVQSVAQARISAPFDCLQLPNEGILGALDRVVAYLGGAKDRVSLMIVAAALVRWKGCQVSQVIQGGAVYRQIENPSTPEHGPADARVLYARIGPHVAKAFMAAGSNSNIVVLI